jgi:hypothetical protein
LDDWPTEERIAKRQGWCPGVPVNQKQQAEYHDFANLKIVWKDSSILVKVAPSLNNPIKHGGLENADIARGAFLFQNAESGDNHIKKNVSSWVLFF